MKPWIILSRKSDQVALYIQVSWIADFWNHPGGGAFVDIGGKDYHIVAESAAEIAEQIGVMASAAQSVTPEMIQAGRQALLDRLNAWEEETIAQMYRAMRAIEPHGES